MASLARNMVQESLHHTAPVQDAPCDDVSFRSAGGCGGLAVLGKTQPTAQENGIIMTQNQEREGTEDEAAEKSAVEPRVGQYPQYARSIDILALLNTHIDSLQSLPSLPHFQDSLPKPQESH